MTGTARLGPQLIAYADRFGGDLATLTSLLRSPLADVFDGVHVLPCFTPFDGVDAGFDPIDHRRIDPRLGSWADIRELATTHTVMADLIVNHMSSESAEFQDVLARGDQSPSAGMFLTFDSVYERGASERELTSIVRPRPGLPFTAVTMGGQRRLVWTTFTSRQVDIDVRDPRGWAYLIDVLNHLTAAGATMIRLDAAGYAVKTRGTSCFLTDETMAFIARLADAAHERGALVLVEAHAHDEQQRALADLVDYVYDFALPPLLLHALHTGDGEPLVRWLARRPPNTVTVLDTHDGIGVRDVAKDPANEDRVGLLSDDQIEQLVRTIHIASGGQSEQATGKAAANVDLYQINCTYLDALGRDDSRHLMARAVQLFLPGIPQIYYVGLLGGVNDMERLARTGVGRDINRHVYSQPEVLEALTRPAARRLVELLQLRGSHPAFDGEFGYSMAGSRLSLAWTHGRHRAALAVDFQSGEATVTRTGGPSPMLIS